MKNAVLLAACFLGLAMTVSAQSKAEFQGWMQTIRATGRSLNTNLEAKSGDAAVADAEKLQEVFSKVLAFWARNNISDAMRLSMDAQSGFQEVAQLAAAGKFDEATEAVGKARNCGDCHRAHRERSADDSYYLIKY